MTKLLSCHRAQWQIVGPLLFTWPPARGFKIVEPPEGAWQLFDEIVGVSDLPCIPELLWLDDAGGAGGFALPGLVAIGAADVAAMVDFAWARYVRPVAPQDLNLYRWLHPNAQLFTRDDLWRAFVQFTLAHELGHIRQTSLGIRGSTTKLEADADRYAGWLSEKLGWNIRLGRIVVHSIGCREDVCTHPSPDSRVIHYFSGRAHRRAQERRDPWSC